MNQILILRDAIRESHSPYENYYLLALAKHIVRSYSNLKFGPEVGISRKKITCVDVNAIWLREIQRMQSDLCRYEKESENFSQIIYGDARKADTCGLDRKVRYVITSPPYPNEKDYSRTTRLESVEYS